MNVVTLTFVPFAFTITVNAKGTKVKVTTFTQPYVGKVRDLQGNVLLAFKGTAEWSSRVNNVVASEVSDPARKLVDAVCEKIADEVVAFFTTELNFKVKTPAGTDEDEVTVLVDGKNVDVEEPTRVLAWSTPWSRRSTAASASSASS